MTVILAGLVLTTLFGLNWVNLIAEESMLKKGKQKKYDVGSLATLVAWMLLPLFGVWLLSSRQPIFTERYLIWAALAFFLLSAAFCVALGRSGRRGMLVASSLPLLILVVDARAIVSSNRTYQA